MRILFYYLSIPFLLILLFFLLLVVLNLLLFLLFSLCILLHPFRPFLPPPHPLSPPTFSFLSPFLSHVMSSIRHSFFSSTFPYSSYPASLPPLSLHHSLFIIFSPFPPSVLPTVLSPSIISLSLSSFCSISVYLSTSLSFSFLPFCISLIPPFLYLSHLPVFQVVYPSCPSSSFSLNASSYL